MFVKIILLGKFLCISSSRLDYFLLFVAVAGLIVF